MRNPYPSIRALGAMIRCDDERAVRYVIWQVKRAGGSLLGAAEAIGVTSRAIQKWRDASPRLHAELEQHAMGREGAGPNATRARLEQRVAARAARERAREARERAARA